jgi:hypothetical protein
MRAETILQAEVMLRLRVQYPELVASQQTAKLLHEINRVFGAFGLVAWSTKKLKIIRVIRAAASNWGDVVNVPVLIRQPPLANSASPFLRLMDGEYIGRRKSSPIATLLNPPSMVGISADYFAVWCQTMLPLSFFNVRACLKPPEMLPVSRSHFWFSHIGSGFFSHLRSLGRSSAQRKPPCAVLRISHSLNLARSRVRVISPILPRNRAAAYFTCAVFGCKIREWLFLSAYFANFGFGCKLVISHVDLLRIVMVRGASSRSTGRRPAIMCEMAR